MSFREWLLNEDAGSPSAKQSLYPMGYGGIGLYPPSDVITWGADAITYMPAKLRQITFVWGDGILANPFSKDSLYEKIKGRTAKQVQDGEVIPQHTVQVGGLKPKGKGFEKSAYVQKSPTKFGFWDLKQIGSREGKYALPISKQPK
jgi:hypothetical protein